MTYALDMGSAPHTVVETSAFIKAAAACMTDEERQEAITVLAENPLAGDLIEGAGGVRKLRFAIGGRGKSGGVRISYYFGGSDIPVFALYVYPKSKKANLTQAQRNELARVAKTLRDSLRSDP
jgi:hypothetical protein